VFLRARVWLLRIHQQWLLGAYFCCMVLAVIVNQVPYELASPFRRFD
jgi:hypothetical protein